MGTVAARLNNTVTWLTDKAFGTRGYTEGAQYQLPRKVPLRIEPKTWFACERTFLAWVSMAVLIGSVPTSLQAYASVNPENGTPTGPITPWTVDIMTVCLLPVAMAMLAYATATYYQRLNALRTKQVGYYIDYVGPSVLCGLFLLVLTVITIVAYVDVLLY